MRSFFSLKHTPITMPRAEKQRHARATSSNTVCPPPLPHVISRNSPKSQLGNNFFSAQQIHASRQAFFLNFICTFYYNMCAEP